MLFISHEENFYAMISRSILNTYINPYFGQNLVHSKKRHLKWTILNLHGTNVYAKFVSQLKLVKVKCGTKLQTRPA